MAQVTNGTTMAATVPCEAVATMPMTTMAATIAAATRYVDPAATNARQTHQGSKRQ
jgi:hypothetical protein